MNGTVEISPLKGFTVLGCRLFTAVLNSTRELTSVRVIACESAVLVSDDQSSRHVCSCRKLLYAFMEVERLSRRLRSLRLFIVRFSLRLLSLLMAIFCSSTEWLSSPEILIQCSLTHSLPRSFQQIVPMCTYQSFMSALAPTAFGGASALIH